MAVKTNTIITAKSGKEYNYARISRTVEEWQGGKMIQKKKQFTGTSKSAAEQKYKEYQKEQYRLQHTYHERLEMERNRTFGDLAEDYTYDILVHSSYAHGTKRRYEQSYRVHVKQSFLMSMPIREVKARTIQDYYQSANVTKQSLKAIHKWMAAFYKWLCLNEYADNVLAAVTMPDKPENKRHDDIIVWDPEEIQTILSCSDGHRLHFMILLMNYAGLRISECLGLKYDDMKGNLLSINRQYYQGEICPPKHNSYRKIPMHSEVITGLEIHKEWHQREAKRNGYRSEYVFTSESGKLLDYGNARRSLVRFYRKHDLPEKSPHMYRSTFCTELCRRGVPLEVASKLMGHKSVEVTAKHYALVKQEAINKLPGISPSAPANRFKAKKPKKLYRKI